MNQVNWPLYQSASEGGRIKAICGARAVGVTGKMGKNGIRAMLALVVAATVAICAKEEEPLKNLTLITWAHAVNDKKYLEASLASNVSMLEADIVIGHVIGKESGPPIPVMAHPPATTSDLALADFLSTVAQYNSGNPKPKGVKLDFKSIEAFEKSQELIAPYTKPGSTFPVWLNADIIAGPVEATTKPLDANKFLQLATKHPRAVLSLGWTTRFGGEITEGEYSRTQIGAMIKAVDRNYVNQTVTFAVRAGLASNSQPVLLDLMRETARFNCSLTVWSSEGDPVAPERLRALIRTVGLEKIYLDVPSAVAHELNLPGPATN